MGDLLPSIGRVARAVHRSVYGMTGGKIGGRVARAPVLLLTTTGRRTGKSRTTPLLYLRHGDDFVVVASNGGADRHPGWYWNLVNSPVAAIQVGRHIQAVRGEVAPAETRALLWADLTRMYPGYERYRARARRDIPVVILRPVTGR